MIAIRAATDISHHLTAPSCEACCAELRVVIMIGVFGSLFGTRPEARLIEFLRPL